MWTIRHRHAARMIGASVAPHTHHKLKTKTLHTFQKGSGFKAAIRQNTDLETFFDPFRYLFQQVKRQSHWSAGVLALVHSVGNGELQFPVFCKQDDQVNAVLAVVDTDVGQLGPHLFHCGQVHAEP